MLKIPINIYPASLYLPFGGPEVPRNGEKETPPGPPSGIFSSLLSNLKDKHVLILIIFLLCFSTFNLVWLANDQAPARTDEADYMGASLRYAYMFSDNPDYGLDDFFEINGKRPPFHMLVAVPFQLATGFSEDAYGASLLVFSCILAFSIFGLGSRFFDKNAGLLAAILALTFPLVSGVSRTFLADYPTTAMTAFSFWMLVLSEGFTKRRYSILFGMATGLGFLAKLLFPVFIIGPVLFVLWKKDILGFGPVKKLLAVARKVPYQTLHVSLLGGVFGTFLWLALERYYNFDSRFGMREGLAAVAGGVVLFLGVWLLFGLFLRGTCGKPLRELLEKDAYSFLPSLLFSIYFVPQLRDIQALPYLLVAAFMAAFVGLKLFLLRDHIGSAWTLRKSQSARSHPHANIVLALLAAFLVCGWWYVPCATEVAPFMLVAFSPPADDLGELEGPSFNVLSPESLSYYFFSLGNQQIMAFFFVVLLFLALVLVWGRRTISAALGGKGLKQRLSNKLAFLRSDRSHLLFLFVWVLAPYIFFSLVGTKNSRYITPYLPAFGLFIAAFIYRLDSGKVKAVVAACLVVLGGAQFVVYAYGLDDFESVTFGDPEAGGFMLVGDEPFGRYQYRIHPDTGDWQVDEVVDDILLQSSASGQDTSLGLVLPRKTVVNPYYWAFSVELGRIPIDIYSPIFYPYDTFYDNVEHLDFFVVQENITVPPTETELYALFDTIRGDFTRIGEYTLPDGSTLSLYERA